MDSERRKQRNLAMLRQLVKAGGITLSQKEEKNEPVTLKRPRPSPIQTESCSLDVGRARMCACKCMVYDFPHSIDSSITVFSGFSGFSGEQMTVIGSWDVAHAEVRLRDGSHIYFFAGPNCNEFTDDKQDRRFTLGIDARTIHCQDAQFKSACIYFYSV